MYTFQRAIVTHGGSSSDPNDSDGTGTAAKRGIQLMKNGKSALDAVIDSVKFLENDVRFNAGTGSKIRSDGHSIQQDASCMISSGAFGGVACVDGIKNPVEIAHAVLHSPHILLSGKGAMMFAEEQNIPVCHLSSPEVGELDKDQSPSCDTVGAVAFDGEIFAAALSSGGLTNAAFGRVGDVPLPGCGLFCGPLGAVACTGDGEFIALKILAYKVYGWLETKMNPVDAAQKAVTLFDETVDVGIIILTANGSTGYARNGMAWSHINEIKKL